MKADPIGVATGSHYIDGDHACAEGAIAAGCRFLAGYPITPSTEVAERMAERFPKVGGMFIQMEDELASMAAVVGAAWAGPKSMTVTLPFILFLRYIIRYCPKKSVVGCVL